MYRITETKSTNWIVFPMCVCKATVYRFSFDFLLDPLPRGNSITFSPEIFSSETSNGVMRQQGNHGTDRNLPKINKKLFLHSWPPTYFFWLFEIIKLINPTKICTRNLPQHPWIIFSYLHILWIFSPNSLNTSTKWKTFWLFTSPWISHVSKTTGIWRKFTKKMTQ